MDLQHLSQERVRRFQEQIDSGMVQIVPPEPVLEVLS
jgi:hypothetical protein